MPSPLSLASIIKDKIAALEVPASLVADLSGISSSHLSNWLNDRLRIDIDGPTSLRIYDETLRLERLIESVSPLKLDFRNVSAIKHALRLLDDGELISRSDSRARTILSALRQEELSLV